jgi:uncharacterized membrane protein YhaH (DUF805 family)
VAYNKAIANKATANEALANKATAKKATASPAPVALPSRTVRSARDRHPPARDELETATPGAIGFSLNGRIGRLRYLAFSWPATGLGCLLAVLAALANPMQKPGGLVLLILVGGMWLWIPLRLMALRLHDLNRSAKWLPALMFLPGVLFVAGSPGMGMICASLFWLMTLLLFVLPGSAGHNDYGPPPGPNTPLITVGASFLLFFMFVGVVIDINLIRSGKLNSVLLRNAGTAAGGLGSGSARDGADADRPKAGRLTRWDFIGSWRGRNMSLRVDRYGESGFSHREGDEAITADGPLEVLDGSHISIGSGSHVQVLSVTEPPHEEGDTTRMTLEGVELVKDR